MLLNDFSAGVRESPRIRSPRVIDNYTWKDEGRRITIVMDFDYDITEAKVTSEVTDSSIKFTLNGRVLRLNRLFGKIHPEASNYDQVGNKATMWLEKVAKDQRWTQLSIL
jgi:hypothetical protein